MKPAFVLLLLVAPALFATVSLASWRRRSAARVDALGVLASWVGVATSVAAAVAVAVGGPRTSPTLAVDGLGLSVRADALSVTMLTMVALLATVIFRYSATYLEGDPRRAVFLGRLAATVAAVEVLVLAGNLGLLVLAWVATSLALHRLLVFHPDRRRARVAARKKFVLARLGDAFLVTGVLVLHAHTGTGDLVGVFDAVRSSSGSWTGAPALAAVALVIAALLKSAQFPAHGWLIEVMETPTPVSALLHAGVLNAGPFLALRMAGVIDGSNTATLLLIVAGGATAAFASVALTTQPAAKVALGYSSAAHMGFMLLVCGLGVYPAALLHLVAHSFYKAHAFLSASSAVDEGRAARVRLAPRLASAPRIAASLLVAASIYAIGAAAFGTGLDPVVLAMGAMLVLGTTQILAPTFDADGAGAATARVIGMAAAVTAAFFTLEHAAAQVLANTTPDGVDRTVVHAVAAGGVLTVFAGIVLAQIVAPAHTPGPRRRALAVHVRNGFYANAVFDRVVGALRRDDAPLPSTPLHP